MESNILVYVSHVTVDIVIILIRALPKKKTDMPIMFE